MKTRGMFFERTAEGLNISLCYTDPQGKHSWGKPQIVTDQGIIQLFQMVLEGAEDLGSGR